MNVHGFTKKKTLNFLLQAEPADLKSQTVMFLRNSVTYVPNYKVVQI